MTALGNLITGLLAIPAVRLFLEDVAVRVWAEICGAAERDPEFEKQFARLAGELADANTEEAKRAILRKIHDLRRSLK